MVVNILAGAAVVIGLFLAIVNVPVALSKERAIAVLKVDDFLSGRQRQRHEEASGHGRKGTD